ncbi:hypothetical protein BGX31_010413 [Mortierella sp. GBA43]|nr:hypothetical protein BGX31_010413 [Mortierella sp. GBA43]
MSGIHQSDDIDHEDMGIVSTRTIASTSTLINAITKKHKNTSLGCTFETCKSDVPHKATIHYQRTHVDKAVVSQHLVANIEVRFRRQPDNRMRFRCVCQQHNFLSEGALRTHFKSCKSALKALKAFKLSKGCSYRIFEESEIIEGNRNVDSSDMDEDEDEAIRGMIEDDMDEDDDEDNTDGPSSSSSSSNGKKKSNENNRTPTPPTTAPILPETTEGVTLPLSLVSSMIIQQQRLIGLLIEKHSQELNQHSQEIAALKIMLGVPPTPSFPSNQASSQQHQHHRRRSHHRHHHRQYHQRRQQ